MNKRDVNEFIERMEEIGDVWEPEDVERVYGNKTLEEALAERMFDLQQFSNIIGTILNRKK